MSRDVLDLIDAALDDHGHTLTDWQYEVIARVFKVPVQMLLSRAEVERRDRLRRMHTEYHRRTRHRRTRWPR